jgi:Trypsin-co-occurring domain 1
MVTDMKRIIVMPMEAGRKVSIEVDDESGAPVTRGLSTGEIVNTVACTFETALEAVKPAALAVANRFRDFANAPETVEVEFGLRITGGAGVVIASVSTEAQFQVKLVWKQRPAS